MHTRRYRVGIDINKYFRLLILCCIITAAIAVIGTAVIIGSIFAGAYSELESKYNTAQEKATMYDVLYESHMELTEDYNEAISYIKTKEIEIQTLTAENTALTAEIEEMNAQKTADFDTLRQFWYVFKEAPDNSGLTVDALLYSDEVCKEWDVNPAWMWHIYFKESGYDVDIDNYGGSGARGLGQVMPSTGKSFWENILGHGAGSFSVEMLYDPKVNIEITTCLIGRNIATSSMSNALELYSGGGGTAYWNRVVNAAAEHGITLTNDNAHYPT